VRAAWSGVSIYRIDAPKKRILFGDTVQFEVALNLNSLLPEDVVVEMLVSRPNKYHVKDFHHYRFEFRGVDPVTGEHRFETNLAPSLCGRLDYRIRVYPSHPLLTHPLEMGLMIWL
jgi:starch phosphorylase